MLSHVLSFSVNCQAIQFSALFAYDNKSTSTPYQPGSLKTRPLVGSLASWRHAHLIPAWPLADTPLAFPFLSFPMCTFQVAGWLGMSAEQALEADAAQGRGHNNSSSGAG